MENDLPQNVCDQEVFKSLFTRYYRLLNHFLYYRCGDEGLAEDLVQEAFLRLWKECSKVPYEKAKSFLFTVANNLFLDHIKHKKVVARFRLQHEVKLSAETPQFLLEEQEFKERLEQAIAGLPEKNRIVFLLNRIEKMTYREIAELLEISVKAVEKRMHKALVELRKLSDNI